MSYKCFPTAGKKISETHTTARIACSKQELHQQWASTMVTPGYVV